MEQAAAAVGGSIIIAPAPAAAAAAASASASAHGRHLQRPAELEPPPPPLEEEEEHLQVYCAVGIGSRQEWKANLQWVLANVVVPYNSRRRCRLVLAHLRRPPSRINMMGAWVPVSQLADEEVAAYNLLHDDTAAKVLDDLLEICKSQKVNATKIVIACDDIAKGLVHLVDHHGVTQLVMGAASDRAYTSKMRAPRSKKALTLQRKANPSCKIWFVCKGNLICTREASEGPHRAESCTSSTSPRSSTSDYSRSKSSPRWHSNTPSTKEPDDEPLAEQTPSIREDNAMDRSMDDLNRQPTAIAGSSTEFVSEIEPAAVHSLQEIEDDQGTTTSDGLDAGEMDDALYEKLKDAIMEAENLRHEAYEETRRRQMAERELAEASKMADEAERSYQREAKHRREMEEMLTRERAAMEQDRRELDAILEKIQKVDDRSAELELQITSSERTMNDLEARLSDSYSLLDALRREHQQQGDPAAAAREPSDSESQAQDSDHQEAAASFLQLGYSELDEATKHFDESARIDGGDGGRGKVYRGELRNVAVAVKVLDHDVAVDEARFTRGVERISRARHPNLVALVGACPEARAIAYELVPGGSLEEQLTGTGGAAAPLPWHARCGIVYGACSALAFLHSRATVHGDVRPATILVDAGRSSCKLAGLGTRALVAVRPGGPAAAYADPQYLATGEVTPRCDVYSLGVVLLQLVTGRPVILARKAAQEAAGGGRTWQEVADAGAGGWPAERARELALVGLKCCDVSRRPRWDAGELLEEARGVLEAALSAAPSRSPSSLSSDSDGAPSYFLCPILKEVMRDPQIAGDGFSYEAEAIQEWLGSGHDTSPMTNLKLPTLKLMPNHALRSAIHEWRHHQPDRLLR